MEVVLAPDKLPLTKLLPQLTCLVVTGGVQIGGGVGVGVADAGRRVQEQHIRHCNQTKPTSPSRSRSREQNKLHVSRSGEARDERKGIGTGPLFQG